MALAPVAESTAAGLTAAGYNKSENALGTKKTPDPEIGRRSLRPQPSTYIWVKTNSARRFTLQEPSS